MTDAITRLTERLAQTESPEEVLELAGQLCLLDADIPAGTADRVPGGLSLTLAVDLDLVAEAVCTRLQSLDAADVEGAFEAIQASLLRRDRVELCRIGAAHLGRALDEETEVEVAAFDAVLRPELWRLTGLNALRSIKALSFPALWRARFWWWSEAVDVDPQGALHLSAVADLLARVPGARTQLEKLEATAHLLAGKDGSPAQVVRLQDWLDRSSKVDRLPMAADTGAREVVLMRHAPMTLSFLAPNTLYVDLDAPRSGGLPRLEADGLSVEGEPVPDALERYRFQVSSVLAEATRVELVLPSDDEVRVTLPLSVESS